MIALHPFTRRMDFILSSYKPIFSALFRQIFYIMIKLVLLTRKQLVQINFLLLSKQKSIDAVLYFVCFNLEIYLILLFDIDWIIGNVCSESYERLSFIVVKKIAQL